MIHACTSRKGGAAGLMYALPWLVAPRWQASRCWLVAVRWLQSGQMQRLI